MIYLLDLARQMKIIQTILFQVSSTIESSLAFLRQLTALIDTSVEDMYRLLKLLQLYVHHTQSPLSEFAYNVENLATDL